jgi:hypothetical protein
LDVIVYIHDKEVKMKKYPTLIAISLLLLLSTAMFPACNGNSNPSPSPVYRHEDLPAPSEDMLLDAVNYGNSEFGFSFKYCQDLELFDSYGDFAVVLLGDLLKDLKHYVNYYVDIEEIPKKQTFEGFVDSSKQVAKEALKDFTIVDEYNTTIDDREARVVIFTFQEMIEDEEWLYKDMLILIQKDNLVYAIRFNTPDEFREEFIDCFNLLLYTFDIT